MRVVKIQLTLLFVIYLFTNLAFAGMDINTKQTIF